MKKIISVCLLILVIFLSSCSIGCKTKECLDYKIQQEELKQTQIEKDRLFQLERLKIQAEIEANKPVEVKVAEIENSGMTTGGGIATAAGIGAAVWAISKALGD